MRRVETVAAVFRGEPCANTSTRYRDTRADPSLTLRLIRGFDSWCAFLTGVGRAPALETTLIGGPDSPRPTD